VVESEFTCILSLLIHSAVKVDSEIVRMWIS